MASQLVFITGVTGHAGFRVLVSALEAGYKVRASIRKAEQADTLRATESLKPFVSDVEFVVVPDILKKDAFVPHLSGVDFVIHVASPLPKETDDCDRDIIQPAIHGTTTMLTDAAKFESIKRVVITSSVVAIIPHQYFAGDTTDAIFNESSRVEKPKSVSYSNPQDAYRASKTLAWYAAEEFIAQNKPSFDIVNIMPAYIIGKNELLTSPKSILDGSNALVMASVFGIKMPRPGTGITVHVNDVGKAHVRALDAKVAGGSNFFLSSNGIESVNLDSAQDIVAATFPAEVKAGIFPLGGHLATLNLRVDATSAEKVLGFKYLSFEEQVRSVAGHYVELVNKTGEKFETPKM